MKTDQVQEFGPTEDPYTDTNERAVGAALILTFLTLMIFVGLIWLSALQSSVDGVTTSSGARAAIVALSASFILAVFVRRLTVWTPRWLPWVGVAVTAGFLSVAALLFQTGNLDTAFAFYGGFQVPRAGRLFSDIHIILSWFSCDFCGEWDPFYGPGLEYLDPLTGSLIGVSWLPVVGLVLAAMALLTIYLLGRFSQNLGQWLIVVGAISPAWLLLAERANLDVLILAAIVVGAGVVATRPTYFSWAAFAVVIWILGTIKTYPFALGVVLLLALGMRWGWVIVGGFLVAAGLFALAYFDSLTRSGDFYASPEFLPYIAGESPAYGWVLLTERLDGLFREPTATLVTLAVLIAVLVFAGWWGWLSHVPRGSQQTRVRLAILSLAGAMAFLAKALVVGFGFAYAGAALLLVVPAIVLNPGIRSLRNGSMVTLAALVLLTIFGAYNVILGTLAGFVVAGFGLGFGARVAWETVHGRFLAQRGQQRSDLGEQALAS